MKLTPKMLCGLIKEAIQTREPGSPLWSPEKTKRTRKTEAFELTQNDSAVSEFIQQIVVSFDSLYDENDPTMNDAGREDWARQCEAAGEDLEEKINELLGETEMKLVDGQFYRGR